MRIYAVADIHARPGHMAAIFSAVDEYAPDLVVAAGDLTHFFRWRTCLSQLDSLPVKVLAIQGNTDLKRAGRAMQKAVNIIPLSSQPHRVGDYNIMGASGTMILPFASRICLNEKQRLGQFPAMDRETILVVHPPPKGILDRVGNRISSGSRNLARFIQRKGPGLVLCGHIHEQPGQAMLGSTMVINCSMGKKSLGAVIDLEKGSQPKVNLLHP